MAKCEVCGKGVTFGIRVSHSHRRSNRAWKPNVKRVKVVWNAPCKLLISVLCPAADARRAHCFFPSCGRAPIMLR